MTSRARAILAAAGLTRPGKRATASAKTERAREVLAMAPPVPARPRTPSGTWGPQGARTAHSGVSEERVRAILEHLTRSPRDARERGRPAPRATATPFTHLENGEIALCGTLAIWQSPEDALRAVWNGRHPGDYGDKVANLNHGLADEATSVFASRGWFSVARRRIPSAGDMDSIGLVTGDPLGIAVEAKAFLHEPLRGADEFEVWDELETNIEALSVPGAMKQVYPEAPSVPERFAHLVVIPGRATAGMNLGPDHSLVGVDLLCDLIGSASDPSDAWRLIKAAERHREFPTEVTTFRGANWEIEFDAVPRSSVPRVARAEAAPKVLVPQAAMGAARPGP